MTPHKFTIDRSRWLAGHLSGLKDTIESRLLDGDDRMCCVGFYAESCGVPRDSLRNEYAVHALPREQRNKIPIGRGFGWMYEANDSKKESAADRELTITKLFAEHNVEVEFVGEYPK